MRLIAYIIGSVVIVIALIVGGFWVVDNIGRWTNNVRNVQAQQGNCPQGYTQQGTLCLQNAQPPVVSNQDCPQGFVRQGNLCNQQSGGTTTNPGNQPGNNPGNQPPTGTAASSVVTGTGNSLFNLVDGRSYDPRTTADNNYADTGVGKRQTWKLDVPASMTLLVFGVRVNDGKMYDRGVLKAYPGPTTVNIDITDGGWIRVGNDRAPGEACVRIQQHVDNNWLMSNVEVPTSWANGCPPLQKFVR